MNWGHRLKELITRNWREKIISLVLAFLFWFMIKAQDARNMPSYSMPPPRMPVPTSPAPSQLTPVIPPPVQLPSELEPMLSPPNSSITPARVPGDAISGSAGL
ncbi:MAG: hypothetical protein K9N47_09125 [Prosthecobacter sp.]|uniref:hypothetical protein n=1 Tax=Prosthecobacter sp. TaxID=1965333 RepID=UPI0025EDB36C|nr:hypothetical protein [Prosthecobacter sp.]MCF7786273.1 hypothetical protein [Prosthecobacter sp.]